MSAGERIRELRLQHGITQEELASYLNTTKQTIYKYETGIITNIPLDKIEKLANKFNVSASFLAGWDDESTDSANAVDDDINSILQELKDRPEMKILFSASSKATKEDIIRAAKFLDAMANEPDPE